MNMIRLGSMFVNLDFVIQCKPDEEQPDWRRLRIVDGSVEMIPPELVAELEESLSRLTKGDVGRPTLSPLVARFEGQPASPPGPQEPGSPPSTRRRSRTRRGT